jgi:lipopolysaccharide export system permease protein
MRVIAFGTMGRYFGRRFLSAVFVVFFSCVGLIALVDFLELTRRFGDRGVGFFSIMHLVLLRLPSWTEQLLPFAVLLGAMGTFLTFSQRMEFVIARSAGLSVWQFTGSAAGIAFVIGVFAVTVYNPISASLKEQATRVEASLLNSRTAALGTSRAGAGIWLRQQSVDGQSILQSRSSAENGRLLLGVRIFSFDRDGKFIERVEAASAVLEEGNWVLSDVQVHSPASEPQEYDTYLVSTNLTLEQVRGRMASADTLSFWNLPEAIEASERAGLRTERYQLQYQVLLARPLLLIAMVIIAAVVSLRMFRFGGVGKMIVGGVIAGFLLYVIARLAEELGESGMVHPAAAAWFPAVFGALMGCLVLLYQEDG